MTCLSPHWTRWTLFAVSGISGRPQVSASSYVIDFIIEPLGMRSTTYFSHRGEESGNLADGMARDGANETGDVFELGWVEFVHFLNGRLAKGIPGMRKRYDASGRRETSR
ncbi:hypothetical protein B0H19DRAFT_1134828 [Mycena capillaripes]|nr:hypothetical protein B0H19DRAFT_1134828 [Mycena capillaripes]